MKRKIRLDILLGFILLSIVSAILTQTNIVRTVEKQRQEELQPPAQILPKTPKKPIKSSNEIILRRELEGFFLDIPEVAWCKFDNNTAYVGFRAYPSDGNAILRGAALHGNKVIDFGCHIWAVYADQRNNPPNYGTLSGKWYDTVTARYGRIK